MSDFNAVKMDLRSLSLIAGTNGSGKSLVLKLAWYSTFLLQHIKIQLTKDTLATVQEEVLDIATTYFAMTFAHPEQFSGFFNIKDDDEFSFDLILDEGKLTKVI